MTPTTVLCDGGELVTGRFRYNYKVHILLHVRGSAVQLVEKGNARRARSLVKRELSQNATGQSWAIIIRVTRKHKVVDNKRVFTGPKEFRQPNLSDVSSRICGFEDVIFRYFTTWRK